MNRKYLALNNFSLSDYFSSLLQKRLNLRHNSRYKLLLILTTTLSISGCATGYHSAENPILGLTGGFYSQKGPGELTEVNFAGNGYIEKKKVAIYLMYRCAEITKLENKEYFIMYKSISDAINGKPITDAYISSVTSKPLGQAFILFEDKPNKHTFSASKVLNQYADLVGK
jgi:hypothetical protein